MTPADLEEAAARFSKNVSDGHNYRDLRVGFIAGAKWQADHTPLPEDTVLFNKGVEEWHTADFEDGEQETVYVEYWMPIPNIIKKAKK